MLKRYISLKLAANILILALSALLVFHVLVLVGLVPSNIVWGGRATTSTQLILMEIGAFIVTALMILMVAIRVNYLQLPKYKGFAKTAMWVMFVILVLNTAGNLTADTDTETLIFTPITIILAVFTYRLAMREEGPAA